MLGGAVDSAAFPIDASMVEAGQPVQHWLPHPGEGRIATKLAT